MLTSFRRGGNVITIHKPNIPGDITLIEIEGVFDAAELTLPDFETHWCD